MNDDLGNLLDNPQVPEWATDFLNQVFAAQQAADFLNTCETTFQEDLQHAAQMTNRTVQA